MSHHSGLENFLSERGESDYVRRIQKEGVETAEEEEAIFLNPS